MGRLALHYEAIPAALIDLLRKLIAEEELAAFTLVGGTALALHLGHRVSVDIAAMKLNAIANRGSKKDFWDYAELLGHFSRDEMLDFFSRKYTSENVWYVEKSLSYFEDAEDEPDPLDLSGRSWEEVKKCILDCNRFPDV